MMIDIVMTTAGEHLHILQFSVRNLFRFFDIRNLFLITARNNFYLLKDLNRYNVLLIDEDSIIPNMTLEDLKELKLVGFPKRAGWYYQQLLKMACAFLPNIGDFYLIWDSDTVLLRPISLIDNKGRMIFTTALEHNPSYFDTYTKLLGEDPQRNFSFISQHMIIEKKIMKELIDRIANNIPGNENWAWKIMLNLNCNDYCQLSEYELFGHYVKNCYPDRAIFRRIAWTRYGSSLASFYPTDSDLDALSKNYYFAAFESYDSGTLKRIRAKSICFKDSIRSYVYKLLQLKK